jgi:hypothetical protein
MSFAVEKVRAVDGQQIPVRTTVQKSGSRSAAQTALNAVRMRGLGLFLKGDDKGIRAGIVMVGHVDGERQVRSHE